MEKLIIWDFDGTLVDTITDVALCFNQALKCHGFPQHPLKAFDRFVGGNLETVVSRMLPPDACTAENIDKVKLTYRNLYLHSDKSHTIPYPGIESLVSELKSRNCKQAINSNKGQLLLEDLSGKLFPKGTFDAVVGYEEGFPNKPDPSGVLRICEICGCDPEQAVYVGDGETDVKTANNAKIPCIFADWGQGSCPETGTAEIAHTVQELRTLLLKEQRL